MSDIVFSETVLITTGRLYPATASVLDVLKAEAESRQDIPILIVETTAGTVVVGKKDLQDADPMLLTIMQAHLDGKWVMVMDSGNGNELSARDIAVLGELPVKWGDHKRIMDKLEITRRKLQRSLEKLVSCGRAETPTRGYYYPVT